MKQTFYSLILLLQFAAIIKLQSKQQIVTTFYASRVHSIITQYIAIYSWRV